jgi:hypothetical protein
VVEAEEQLTPNVNPFVAVLSVRHPSISVRNKTNQWHMSEKSKRKSALGSWLHIL